MHIIIEQKRERNVDIDEDWEEKRWAISLIYNTGPIIRRR